MANANSSTSRRATKRPGATVLTLVPSPTLTTYQQESAVDCIAELRRLLKQAMRGELIGFAIATMYEGRNYEVNTVGEADSSPTFARGMVRALDDHLKDKVHGS